MGHSRIGKLPASRLWKGVVMLIAGGADVAAVASSTAVAAQESLRLAGKDPMLRHIAWLLARIPLAARQADFVRQLRALGLIVSDHPTLVEICSALSLHLDDFAMRLGRHNDFAEIAQLAVVESLMSRAATALPSLVGLTEPSEDARIALGRLGTMVQFGVLARDFYARLIRRHLDYYLSRELPNHVGLKERFHSLRDHSDFTEALDRHCHEAALIVKDYAGQWFSKTEYEGGIDEGKAGKFASYGFEKVARELEVRSGALVDA